MKVLAINSYSYASTGKIMMGINKTAKSMGIEYCTSFPNAKSMRQKGDSDSILIGTRLGRNLHILLARITGLHGCFSILDTYFFLKKVNKINPDIIHLHNIHGDYINISMLFNYIKKRKKKVVWTLHDCWAFTGQCPHFTMIGCEKWKEGCYNCKQYRYYPSSWIDRSKKMWRCKKRWFTGVGDMIISTPSRWLENLVKESFLKEYDTQVINNGIDIEIFKPAYSDFREKYNIPEAKKVLLGVSFGWDERKGADVFFELSKRLDGEKYQIVMVGTNENIDRELPTNIISIHRTNNQKELAEIYAAADLFVNPTREDTYPTVNMEAIACGTPVITFNTGGSPEIIDKETGCVVTCDDVDSMEKRIIQIFDEKLYVREACIKKAIEFDMKERLDDYIELYYKMLQ